MDDATRTAAILGDITKRLAAMPLPAPQRAKVFENVLVEMINAAGVPMHGWTAYSNAAASPPETQALAAALGTTATPHRGSYTISPFARPAASASGNVIYQDAETGERMTLLVRTRKQPGQWTCPAGYMDILPEAPAIYPERTDMRTRDTLEERTLNAAAMPGEPAAAPHKTGTLTPEAFAAFAQAKPVLDAEYQRLKQEKGWQEAERLMQDEWHVMGVLVQHGVKLPQQHGFDFDAKGCWQRELKEEGGLDLAQYPDPLTLPVHSGLSYGFSSANSHTYTANTHFLTDLGMQAAAPQLSTPESDIVEAAWVPLRAITQENGHYTVQGNTPLPLDDYMGAKLEQAVEAYMQHHIRQSTHGEYATLESMQQALRVHPGAPATLLGDEGQDALERALHVAQGLAHPPLSSITGLLSLTPHASAQLLR